MKVVWYVQVICGPSFLAYRPGLWRCSVLLAVLKAGNPRWHASFRLIFVKVQLGLLQETLLSKRLKQIIGRYLMPCQSGYWKGVEDPHLVLHTVSTMAKQECRQLWLVLGDCMKAFLASGGTICS